MIAMYGTPHFDLDQLALETTSIFLTSLQYATLNQLLRLYSPKAGMKGQDRTLLTIHEQVSHSQNTT